MASENTSCMETYPPSHGESPCIHYGPHELHMDEFNRYWPTEKIAHDMTLMLMLRQMQKTEPTNEGFLRRVVGMIEGQREEKSLLEKRIKNLEVVG